MTADTERNEARLKKLLEANEAPNRVQIALQAREKGQPVVGLVDMCVPEELIMAAGMLPQRITATYKASTPNAWVHRTTELNLYYTHVLESVLTGELDYLNGVICTNTEDDGRRLYDVIASTGKFKPAFMLFIPEGNHQADLKYFTLWLGRLKSALETAGGKPITAASLKTAIELCNQTRSLLRSVYELRKQPKPALSGTEMMRLCLAAKVMPRTEFNQEIAALLPYLRKRESAVNSAGPRLLVSADYLDDWRYLGLIEAEVGAVVAMDDLDYGGRYCWEDCSNSGEDPVRALAGRYLSLPDYSGQGLWVRGIDRVLDWIREFNIAGVIELSPSGIFPREMRTPYFRRRCEAAGIPFVYLRSEYQLANQGQITTRIGAFVEMLAL
ncbi:MAG: 2-hydroxyacyl-CoA dehydratase [Chloroflexi bacterium]|nr:2-hydroxyacyl-CoA dehydratase [Chloroflexota bacterium]